MRTRLLVVVGLGVRRLTSSGPFPLPTPFVFSSSCFPFQDSASSSFWFLPRLLLPLPILLRLFLLPTSTPHPEKTTRTHPGNYSFCFSRSHCLKRTPKLFIGCVWKLRRPLTSVSSHCETICSHFSCTGGDACRAHCLHKVALCAY